MAPSERPLSNAPCGARDLACRIRVTSRLRLPGNKLEPGLCPPESQVLLPEQFGHALHLERLAEIIALSEATSDLDQKRHLLGVFDSLREAFDSEFGGQPCGRAHD